MELDGIFLDMYGTLTAGDRHAVESVCADIVRDQRMEMTAYDLSIHWGGRFFAGLDGCHAEAFLTLFEIEIKTLVETMQSLGQHIDPLPYVLKLQQYWRDPPLQPEALEFLATCRHPICLVSNADRADIDALLTRHQITLDHVITSEDVRSYKPHPHIFETALTKTGWCRERVIHIGDSLHSDVGGAIAAGLRSGWVNRVHRIHDIGTHEPHHEFTDLKGVLSLAGALANV
jgi:2-haloacid dehalogenase